MTKKNVTNLIHWAFLVSGAVVSAAGVFTQDAKLAPYALGLISVAQVIHKFTDALDHKATLESAVALSITAIKL